MDAADHIKVVFRKSAYSLMSRVTTFLDSIVTAIVNSDAYQRSPLMDKWESKLYMYMGIIQRYNYLSICRGGTKDLVGN